MDLITFTPPDSLLGWIYSFQTLIAGIVAFVAGLLANFAARAQARQLAEIERYRRSGEGLRAAMALEARLAPVWKTLEECIDRFQDRYNEDRLLSETSLSWTLPGPKILGWEEVIEIAGGRIAPHVLYIVADALRQIDTALEPYETHKPAFAATVGDHLSELNAAEILLEAAIRQLAQHRAELAKGMQLPAPP